MRWLVGDVASSCMSEPCSSNRRPQVEDREREKSPPQKERKRKKREEKEKGKGRKEEYSLAVLFTMVPALSNLSIVVVLVDDPGASGKEDR